jgi:Fe2+ or Zn2+ uptake regulation protein
MVRITKTQQHVISLLSSSSQPLTLQVIFERVKRELPHTAFSTIYRIVQRLEHDGRVTRIDWRTRASHYEWAEHPHHHHIVCESCDSVQDLSDTALQFNESFVAKHTGFKVKHHSIELVGVCAPCQQKGNR